MRLRLFEPRYIRLISEASSGKRQFALAQVNPYVSREHPERVLPLATRVSIEDFEQLDDGLLGITIVGVEKVSIVERWQEADGLQVANTKPLPHWSTLSLASEYQPLIEQFQKILQQNPTLHALYPTPEYDDAAWLASRYLELLPMQPALKQMLASEQSPTPCLDSLQAWLSHQA